MLQLACFDTPTEVAKQVKERFDISIERQQVYHYQTENAAKEWRDLYAATREAYIKDTAASAIAQQGFRVRELEKLFLRAKARGADKLASEFLRQAAEEMGGVYTNARIFNGKLEASLHVRSEPKTADESRELLRAAGVDA